MSRPLMEELKEKADSLSMEEDLELIDHLVHKIRASHASAPPRRKWSEICGTAPHPLTGEDAQAWVKRTRQESDSHRDTPWK
jgi:hypothetical protein